MTTVWSRREDLRELGWALRELRARRRLSQEALGYRSGLHRNYVGAIERGEQNITFRILVKLTHGLGIPLSELIEIYERNGSARRSSLAVTASDLAKEFV